MAKTANLNELLSTMKPKLREGEFVFCMVSEMKFRSMNIHPVSTFREKEGVTAILDRASADSNAIQYSNVWRIITLTVHSDLEAVGFLSTITGELSKNNIGVNVVSAYYHDHLFVLAEKADAALKIIKQMEAKAAALRI
jgi:uncharacterized protein